MADIRDRLQRAAAGAADPKDRAWAAAKYQEMFGQPAASQGVPEKLQRPSVDELDAAMQARKPAPEEPGLLSKLGQQLKTEVRGLGHGLGLPIDPSPEERAISERMEALGSGLSDVFTLGAGPAATDLLGLTSAQRRSEMEAKHQPAAMAGRMTGGAASAMFGPAAMLNKAVTGAATRVAPELMARAEGQIGAGALTGGALGAAETGDLDGFGGGAAMGTAGAAIPSAIQAGRNVAQKIPMVKKYAQAKEAGRLPEAEALPDGQVGMTRASETARDKVLARKGELKSQAQGEYESAVAPERAKPADVTAIQEGLAKLRAQNIVPSTGEVIDEALENQLASLHQKMGESPDIDSVLRLRKSLKQAAGFKNPSPTPDQLAVRQIYKAFKKGAHNASPVVKEADAAFSSAKTQESKVNQILGSKNGVDTGDEASMRRAAAELEHYGNESVPAIQRQPGFDRLAKLDPAYAEALKQLEAKRALEATRLLTLTPGARTNLTPAVEHLGGMPLQLAMQYGRGIGRVADQALAAAQPAAGMAPRLSLSLIDAYLARRNQEQKK